MGRGRTAGSDVGRQDDPTILEHIRRHDRAPPVHGPPKAQLRPDERQASRGDSTALPTREAKC